MGFGCGAVGGLMVRGEPAEMTRVVARALELGITYFDTAHMYGDGVSETNLGRVMKELKPGDDVVIGTKLRITGAQMDDIPAAVVKSVEEGLQRLQMERVDLYQLHNTIGVERNPARDWIGVADLPAVVETFRTLQKEGKLGYWGLNGLGETAALHGALESVESHTMQICYNLLNPSAAAPMPPGQGQDYARLIDKATSLGVGSIAIRVLAGGALSGSTERHPVAAQSVSPIATGDTFDQDAATARSFLPLVVAGHVESLVELAIRFVLSTPQVATVMVGLSDMEQLETAARYAARGPLSPEALAMVDSIREGIKT